MFSIRNIKSTGKHFDFDIVAFKDLRKILLIVVSDFADWDRSLEWNLILQIDERRCPSGNLELLWINLLFLFHSNSIDTIDYWLCQQFHWVPVSYNSQFQFWYDFLILFLVLDHMFYYFCMMKSENYIESHLRKSHGLIILDICVHIAT